MTSPARFPIDLAALVSHSIIKTPPSWEQVQGALERLKALRAADPPAPYEGMEDDRDALLQFAARLQRSADVAAYSICLAAHLGQFSKAAGADRKFQDALAAIATGLDLHTEEETRTRTELQRCLRAVIPESINMPSLPKNPTDADYAGWQSALEKALHSIRSLTTKPETAEVQRRAWDMWQQRLLASGTTPEIPADIDYLRSRTEGSLPGMILRLPTSRLTLLDWSAAYVTALSKDATSTVRCPLWFGLGVLAAIGFDMGRELDSAIADAQEDPREVQSARQFLQRASSSNPRKALIVLRTVANSLTSDWRHGGTVPTLVLTPEELTWTQRINLNAYFQSRLHGILIEVDPAEQPAAALSRVRQGQSLLPNVRLGFLLPMTPLPTLPIPEGLPHVVKPSSPASAVAAFQVTGTPTS